MKQLIAICLAVMGLGSVSAAGFNPVEADPSLLASMAQIEITVMGANAGQDQQLVSHLQRQIEQTVLSQFASHGIATTLVPPDAKLSASGKPRYAILFRITEAGPKQTMARAWIELFDQVVHVTSGRPTQAEMWSRDHAVSGPSKELAGQALVQKVQSATEDFLKLYDAAGSSRTPLLG